MISKTCIYGIQSAIYIASQPPGQWVAIQTIAKNLNISFHFLTKVLQQLTAVGIMMSQRGAHGGVMLAKLAESISLFDIITAIDGSDIFEQCMLGLPGCGSAKACPVHDKWVALRTEIARVFMSTTLEQLAGDAMSLNVRLAHPEMHPRYTL